MLKLEKVWASLPTVDLDRSVDFYQNKLGLDLLSNDGNQLMFGAGGDTGIMLYMRGPSKADHTVAGWTVGDLEAEVKDLKAKGVVFEEYDMPGIKTVDGIATMGETKAAWFKDPDNNILSLYQM